MYALRKTTTLNVVLALVLALLFTVLTMFGSKSAGADTGPEVEPNPIDGKGNFSCASQGYDYELKIDASELAEGQTYTAATTKADDSGPLSVTLSNLVLNSNEVKQFDWASNNFAVDAVIVKAQLSHAFIYDPPQESMGDDGLYAPDGKGISHISFCYDLELKVSKTANTSLKRTYGWTIDKSVTPATWDLFMGDSGKSEYTVSVTKDQGTDSNWKVTGTITVTSPIDATVTGVTDVITPDANNEIQENVDCGNVTFPYQLSAGQELKCTYSADLSDASTRTNTATATTSTSRLKNGTGTANVDFGQATINEVNDQVTVKDAFKGNTTTLGTATASKTFEPYTQTFECDADEGTHENTATVYGDNNAVLGSDKASVTVNCHELAVTKDAKTSLKRTYNWTIDKSVTPATWDLFTGDSGTSKYTITVDKTGSTDSNWKVSGEITVNNPAPIAATLTGVSDVLPGATNLNVACSDANGPVTFPYTLASGGTLKCTYGANLPDAQTRTNTAKATLQNHDYDPQGQGTASGTTDFDGTATVDFSNATMNKIDDNVTVSDNKAPDPPFTNGVLGTANVSESPKTFTYNRDLSYAACGQYTEENTASFVTDDTGATGQDTWTINVNVPCGGCTLTIGYWKTHSADSPGNQADMVTQYLPIWLGTPGGAHSVQITTSAQAVMYLNKFEDSSNGIRKLQAQLLAAKLNVANGASTQGIASIISSADAFLAAHPASDWTTAGKLTKKQKNEVLSWATKLDNYNNGIIGPGHCSE